MDQPSHSCLDHLAYRENWWRETHGEDCNESWLECTFCGKTYTSKEVQQLQADQEGAAWYALN